MPFGFLCCGPTTVANVVDTSEDDSSDYCEVVRGGGGDGLRTPVGMVVDDSGLRHRRRISGSSSSSEEIGFMARFTSVRSFWCCLLFPSFSAVLSLLLVEGVSSVPFFVGVICMRFTDCNTCGKLLIFLAHLHRETFGAPPIPTPTRPSPTLLAAVLPVEHMCCLSCCNDRRLVQKMITGISCRGYTIDNTPVVEGVS